MTEISIKLLQNEEKTYRELHRAAYSLLSDAVLSRLGISVTEEDIIRGEHGKPFFRDIPLHFGIAHCKGFAVCAVSDDPVGIDCETKRKYSQRTAAYAFTPEECDLIASAEEPDITFTRMWTLKESYVKYTGTGLAGHFHDAVFRSCGDIPEAAIKNGENVMFRCFELMNGLYVSVCLPGGCDAVSVDDIRICR